MRYPYEVRMPLMDGPERWQVAYTISQHRTISGAMRSLKKRERGAASQGGFSQDSICQYINSEWVPINTGEE